MYKRSVLFIVIILSFNASLLFAQDSITVRKPNTDKIKIFFKKIFPTQNSTIEPSIPQSKTKVKKPSIKKIKEPKPKKKMKRFVSRLLHPIIQ